MAAANRFHWRIFVSFGLTLAFLVLTASGIVLYLAPPGRVANWTGWMLLGMTKSQWQEQHTLFALAFVILSLFHLLLFNWQTFLAYLRAKASGTLKHPAELFAALVMSLAIGLGTWHHLQPFSLVVTTGRQLSASWETREDRPPVPHAETLPLRELARLPQLNTDEQELVGRLRAAGLNVRSSGQSLAQIAAENKIAIRQVTTAAGIGPKTSRLPVNEWGNRSVREVAQGTGVSEEALLSALRMKGIAADSDERLDAVASKNRMTLQELMTHIEAITERR